MSNKKVNKYDNEWNLCKTYNSVKECIDDIKVCDTTLVKHSNNKTKINDFYYIIQPYENTYRYFLCYNCGIEIRVSKSRYENRTNIFCSKKCESEYKKSHQDLNCVCSFCGKPIHRQENELKRYKNFYCSKECFHNDKKHKMSGENNHQFGLKGNKNSSWKSDEKISYYGYKLIRELNHPFKNCDGFVFEHRLVAEKYLLNDENSIIIDGKKYLKDEFVVHHINFNRQDNDVKNLQIMSRGSHTKFHIEINNDIEKFKHYCKEYQLDFNEVFENHIYNIEHYKYSTTKESV